MKQCLFTLAQAALCVAATTAFAQDIQNHPVQTRFLSEPCTAVIAAIDKAPTTPEGMGHMAMTFGFLMGVEAMTPGIRGQHETILSRLRNDCAQNPDKTAMELLRNYVP